MPRAAAIADLGRLGVEPPYPDTAAMRTATGCDACRGSGYRGRLGIFELLAVDELVRRRIAACATASEIKAAALPAGMRSLRDDGVAEVLAGNTTADEVLRATMRAEE